MLLWIFYELALGIRAPFPAPSGAAFLALGPCFVGGFMVYGSGAREPALTFKRVGDLGVVLSAMAFCSLLLLYGPARGEHSPLVLVSAFAHPIFALTTVSFALVSLWQRDWGPHRRVLVILLAALAIFAVAESLYAHGRLLHVYEAGGLVDVLWTAALALVVWAAMAERSSRVWAWHRSEPRAAGAVDALVPAFALGAVAVIGYVYRDAWVPGLELPLFLCALGGVGFIGLRGIGSVALERALREKMRDRDRDLLLTQKMQALGTLAAGLAHDFNNQLTGVMVGLDMLRRSVEPGPRVNPCLDLVQQSAQRVAELTERLRALSLSRRTQKGPADLPAIVDRVAGLVRRGAAGRVEVRTRTGSEPLVVHGDEVQLEQALLNLAINAEQATPSGGVIEIGCDLRRVDGPRRRAETGGSPEDAVLWVHDTGTGIEPSVRERLFEPFFTTKAATEGIGLGLTMVNATAKAHGGSVRVESEPGHGARFEIHLPAVLDRLSKRPAPDPHALPEGRETVLLVDDRDEPLMAAKTVLESCGYHVLIAWSGPQALERLAIESTGAQLVVTDAIMPAMSGPELLEAIRAKGYDLPVVLMSGFRDSAESEGFAATVNKPFTPMELARAVRRALDGG